MRLKHCLTIMILTVLIPVMAPMGAATSHATDDNLVSNSSFDTDLNGWAPFNATTVLTRDTGLAHSAPASLRVDFTAERNAAKSASPILLDEGVTKLQASYWGFREDMNYTAALVTLQLRLTFDDDSVATYYPLEYRLTVQDAGQWVHKSGAYTAPEGRTIKAVEVFLINNAVNVNGYNGRVWFDDIVVTVQEPERSLEITGLTPLIAGDAGQAVVQLTEEDGSKINVTESAAFSSDDPSVAAVDAEGQVTAVGAGVTVIRAVYDELEAEYVLRVFEYDVNIIPNPSFSANLDGWEPFNITSQMVRDTARYHSGPASVKVLHTTERNAIQTSELIELPPGVTHLYADYYGFREDDAVSQAIVTMQLKITFNEDETSPTHWPPDFRLSPNDAGDWVYKSTLYTAPEGKTIKTVQVLLINNAVNQPAYQSPVWFDDIHVSLVHVPTEGEIGLAEPVSDDPAEWEKYNAVKAFLDANDIASVPVKTGVKWEGFHTVIVPSWDDSMSRHVRDRWYLGGRVLLIDVPDTVRADLAMWYVFAYDPDLPPPSAPLTSDDGRALYLPSVSDLTDDPDGLAALLELHDTAFDYPEIPADVFEDQPNYTLENGVLMVDDEPFYIRGPGFYEVGHFGGRQTPRDYEADLAELVRSGQNTVIGYVNLTEPKSEVLDFLDAAQDAGIKVMLWFRDDVAYRLLSQANAEHAGSEVIPMPWQDRYMQVHLQLRNHPAILGYIIADDTVHDFFPWLQRMSQFIRHYDERNFVTLTSLTLRNPSLISPAEWEDWKQIVDFPTSYIYPLHNYAQGLPTVNGTQGYEVIRELADNIRGIWGDNAFFVFWPQAHMQGVVYESFGLTVNDPARQGAQEAVQPFADQQRLILYKTVMAGAKGQFIFRYSTANEDDSLAMGRRNIIEAVYGELAPFDALILAGARTEESVSAAGLEAYSYADEQSKVILVATRDPEVESGYTRGGMHTGVSMEVEAPNGFTGVYQYDGLSVTELDYVQEGDTVSFTLQPFDTTTVVFMSSDSSFVNDVIDQRQQASRRNLILMYNAVLDTRAKTEVYHEKIADAVEVPAGVAGMLADAAMKMQNAKTIIDCGLTQFEADAYDELLEANLLYRSVQEQLIEQAAQLAETIPSNERIKRQIGTLIGLPQFYHENFEGPAVGTWEMGDGILNRLAQYGGQIPPDDEGE
jgi:uncharacterized protein Usg